MINWRTILSYKMEPEPFKAGDKVIPHSKTTGCDWVNSRVLDRMELAGQNWLYVNKIDYDGIVVCRFEEDMGGGGDYFLAGDLEHYS